MFETSGATLVTILHKAPAGDAQNLLAFCVYFGQKLRKRILPRVGYALSA